MLRNGDCGMCDLDRLLAPVTITFCKVPILRFRTICSCPIVPPAGRARAFCPNLPKLEKKSLHQLGQQNPFSSNPNHYEF